MNIDKTLEELYSLTSMGIKLGLDNINQLLHFLGDPQKKMKVIQRVKFRVNSNSEKNKTYLVENYPGFFETSGYDLMEAFQKHYEFFKVPFIYDTVTELKQEGEHGFEINTSGGLSYKACSVIITTGTKHRKMNVPGEEELHGRGVSYCATCDGPFFRDKNITSSNILIPRSNLAINFLPEALEELRNTVKKLVVYKNQLPMISKKVEVENFDQVIFTSPSGVDNFIKVYGKLPVKPEIVTRGKETQKRVQSYKD